MNDARKILGIDPATHCGFAHSDGHLGTWHLTGRTAADKFSMLRTLLMKAHQDWGYDAIAYEDSHQVMRNRRIIEFQIGTSTTIRQTAHDLGVEVLEPFNPASVKKWLTGSGKAKKPQMVAAIRTFYGIELEPEQHDAADAWAILKMAESGYVPPRMVRKASNRAAKVAAKKQPTLFPMDKIRQVRRSS